MILVRTDCEIEFDPEISEMFILYAIAGRELSDHPQRMEESAYLWWIQLNKPSMLTEKGREFIADKIPSDTLDYLRTISKSNFFDVFREMRRRGTFLGKPRLVID